ncbi:hypothetical protein ACIGPN_28845 [Streptomyces afghaniensis]|uniref:hypothetical protein n=1 Tax=Streptomyces TaxID=1883 RepID=UPI001FAFDAFD|nr:hypothetical protein [Streptomyces sp. HP-A2021]UOB15407.1 hypothetical protein MQE23_43125 [Streptomyces sp. HP-A2021]
MPGWQNHDYSRAAQQRYQGMIEQQRKLRERLQTSPRPHADPGAPAAHRGRPGAHGNGGGSAMAACATIALILFALVVIGVAVVVIIWAFSAVSEFFTAVPSAPG